MKQTREDRDFAARFASALRPHVDREASAGRSLKEIAEELGVTSWGLQKQLGGGTPSIRTIARAYARYGVSAHYEGIALRKALTKKPKMRKNTEEQMVLPFLITAPTSGRKITLKLLPGGVRKYELRLSVG